MGDPDCCPRCGTFWQYHDEEACANDAHRNAADLRDRIDSLEASFATAQQRIRELEKWQSDALAYESTVPALEDKVREQQQRIQEMADAANQFAAGVISSGKLAEVLGCEDKHGFKTKAHAHCELDDYFERSQRLESELSSLKETLAEREQAFYDRLIREAEWNAAHPNGGGYVVSKAQIEEAYRASRPEGT